MPSSNEKKDPGSEVLNNIMIAAPCNIGWDNMVGDDRVRLCAGCDKNVYNTSRMTKAEIKELLAVEGKAPCLRIYRRADGTMLTEDCPVGLRRVRDAWRRVTKVAASIWACALSVTSSWGQTVGQNECSSNASKDVAQVRTVLGGPINIQHNVHSTSGQPGSQNNEISDKSALQAFYTAGSAVTKNNLDQADTLFSQAITCLDKGNHDPKFVELVYKSYADFLKSNGKPVKANDVLELLSKYNSEHFKVVEPTVIDGGGLDHGRSERHQKTSPTLLEGAPIPDNE